MIRTISRAFATTSPNKVTNMDKSMLKPFYQSLTQRVKSTELENSLRLKSLYSYRRLILSLSGCYESNLHVQNKIEELRYTFQQNSEVQSESEILLLHQVCQDILNKIESGQYPPFPEIAESDDCHTYTMFYGSDQLQKMEMVNAVDGTLTGLGGDLKGEKLEEEMKKTGMRVD